MASGSAAGGSTRHKSENPAISPEIIRFRVDRVNSRDVGCHRATVRESKTSTTSGSNPTSDNRDNLPYITSYPLHKYEPPSPSSSGDTVDLISSPTGSGFFSNPINFAVRRFSNKQNLSEVGIPISATMDQNHPPPQRKFSLAGILGRKKSSNLPELDDFHTTNNTTALYGKSLNKYTHDALPKMENYRDILDFNAAQRPTIDELHEEYFRRKSMAHPEDAPATNVVKFGWIEGCLVRCLLNIWGVMLFLRLSWMTAHAGIAHSMIIIVISTVVTTITTLSMSAVSTNGEIKGGGIYFMIARTIGPEWGGAVGIIFSFSNFGMAALNTVGFSESFISLLQTHGVKIVDGAQNDNRIISCLTIIILQSIIVIGMEWEAKAQMGLLVILLVAMIDFVVGAFMGPKGTEEVAKGWVGLSGPLFLENFGPGYKLSDGIQQDFFSIFSIFFPAVAGIQAGASISGDLKNPAEAIPKGTLLAIFITSGSYAAFSLLAGTGVLREASGIVDEVGNGTFTNCTGRQCQWGLYNDYQVMQLVSAFGPVIYAGCFAATLSSALSCMVSGAKTMQALCKDKVYPYLTKFGIGYGKTDDPYWSYAVGFLIAVIFILIADLNALAALISNMFMTVYALLNFSAFHASLVRPPSWRPTFRYYNTWICLIGAILCVVVMFMMSWAYALLSLGCAIALYCGVIYRKPELNWGTSTQAQTYSDALSALQTLTDQQDHVKNYRPQILCLSGFPSSRPALVDFANLITKKQSLLICGHIVKERQSTRVRKAMIKRGYDWLHERRIKAFYVLVDNVTFDEGTQALLQATGIGKLAPNIVLLGYKSNWQTCPKDELRDFFTTIHECFDNHMSMAILRVKEGLDCSHLVGSLSPDGMIKNDSQGSLGGYVNNGMELDATDPNESGSPQNHKEEEIQHENMFGKKGNKSADGVLGVYRGPDGTEVPKDIVENLSLFLTKQSKGTIDVWWLYDDGGLTLLLPYIVNQRKNWQQCKLRVFALANKKEQMEQEMKSMAILLAKFRIDYSDLTVIPDITRRTDTNAPGRVLFDSLIKDFRGDPDDSDNPETVIGESELFSMKEKTNRHLRLRELLLEHSQNSNLIVMTLPIPRKGNVSAPLYMAWLEMLTRDMPPFLLVRGNQASVLTFYS
ncbi:bumetanide-sensitive sodium-(potassium)-chloride cotransporter [Folsomia candida]|uniref:bumetanide-sensitive sodium-(potassium)-chloride cotransporter n=1 Tax=Folsomia candida TaxID=158441 RepID=UPI000B906F7B|nr:bumetanide-sensitive sodium-(potassium)-chloride cotransporter [Folsomia candida]